MARAVAEGPADSAVLPPVVLAVSLQRQARPAILGAAMIVVSFGAIVKAAAGLGGATAKMAADKSLRESTQPLPSPVYGAGGSIMP